MGQLVIYITLRSRTPQRALIRLLIGGPLTTCTKHTNDLFLVGASAKIAAL